MPTVHNGGRFFWGSAFGSSPRGQLTGGGEVRRRAASHTEESRITAVAHHLPDVRDRLLGGT
jgi:hypothetical protein